MFEEGGLSMWARVARNKLKEELGRLAVVPQVEEGLCGQPPTLTSSRFLTCRDPRSNPIHWSEKWAEETTMQAASNDSSIWQKCPARPNSPGSVGERGLLPDGGAG